MLSQLCLILSLSQSVFSEDTMFSPRDITLEAEKMLLGDNPDLDGAIELLSLAADYEDAYAQAILGDIYYHCDTGEDTKGLGLTLLNRSAMNGNSFGELWLAEAYLDYKTPDYPEIVRLLEKSASKGRYCSYWHLGMMNFLGIGVEKNMDKCLEFLSLGAEGNDPMSLLYLGKIYYHGEDVNKDYARALDLLLRANAQGEKESLVYLGLMYKYGLGVTKNTDEARKYLCQAILRPKYHWFLVQRELRTLR